MKRIAVFALALLLIVMTGCGASIKEKEPDVTVSVQPSVPTSPEEPTQTPEPVPMTFSERLVGVYHGAEGSGVEGEDVVVEVSCICGIIVIEYNSFFDGELYTYWVDEMWPEDTETLKSTNTGSLKGKKMSFSELSLDGMYWEAATDAEIALTDNGFSLYQTNDEHISYYERAEENGIHSDLEDLKQELSLDTGSTPTGSWSYEGLDWAAMLSLNSDGSFTYAYKIVSEPIFVLKGAWGTDEDRIIRIIGERIGGGKQPREYALGWNADGENITLCDASTVTMLPEDGDLYFYATDSDWVFPDFLFIDYSIPVAEYFSEQGEYTDQYDGVWSYSYYIPMLTENTQGAMEINGEIAGKYEYYARCCMENMESGETIEYTDIGWYACRYKDIVSLIVYGIDIGSFTEYSVFCYDISTGARFYSNSDLLQELNIPQEDAVEATRNAAYNCFVYLNSELSEEDREQYGYDGALERTISDQYVRDGAMLYVDETGELIAIVPVASMVGADWYYQALYLSVGTDEYYARQDQEN